MPAQLFLGSHCQVQVLLPLKDQPCRDATIPVGASPISYSALVAMQVADVDTRPGVLSTVRSSASTSRIGPCTNDDPNLINAKRPQTKQMPLISSM